MPLLEEALLEGVLAHLRSRLPEALYTHWFSRVEILAWDGGRLELGVPNRFFKDRIETSYAALLRQAAEQSAGCPVTIAVTISPRLFKAFEKERQASLVEAEKLEPPAIQPPQAEGNRRSTEMYGSGCDETGTGAFAGLPLNPEYTFENFVVGSSNRLSHAVARRMLEKDPGQYNRVFLFGQHGVGKTHLLQAVCREASQRRQAVRTIYVTCRRFVDDFGQAHAAGKLKEFRAFYRGADILAFDELQALGDGNKAATQAELLSMIDEMDARGALILFASTVAPADLDGVDAKLRDRLGAGFVDQLALPDENTRQDLISRKMAERRIALPQTTINLIAHEVSGNVRTLEGTVNRLAALIELEGMEPTLSCIRLALEVARPTARKSALTFADVIKAVAEEFALTPEAIVGRARVLPVKKARQVAIVLCRRLVGGRYAELGAAFGGRSHATIISVMKNLPRDMFSSGLEARPVERILFRLGVSVKPEELLERQKELFGTPRAT